MKFGEETEQPAYDEILVKLKNENKEEEIDNLLWSIRWKRRFADPNELLFLLDRDSDVINQQLALTLQKFRHKNTRAILYKLLANKKDETREFAASSLLVLYGQEIKEQFLQSTDEAIQAALSDWQIKKAGSSTGT